MKVVVCRGCEYVVGGGGVILWCEYVVGGGSGGANGVMTNTTTK